MGRIWALIFTLTLTAAAQVAYYPGTNVPAPAGVQAGIYIPPQIEAGHIALPGSGTPPGAPVQQGANDARNGGSGYDWIPGAVTNVDALRQQANSQGAALPGQIVPEENAQAQAPRTGIQNFEAAQPYGVRSANAAPAQTMAAGSAPAAPNASLADLARRYKGRSGAIKQYTNEDIMAMNNGAGRSQLGRPESLNQQPALDKGDLAAVNAALSRHDQGKLMAENRSPALPQSDRVADEPGSGGEGGDHGLPADQQSANASAQESSAQTAAANGNATAQEKKKGLPQTSSSLPLMFGLGFIAVAGGALWKLRG